MPNHETVFQRFNMSEDKIFSIIFNKSGGNGRRKRIRRRQEKEKTSPEECEVIVPPSMRAIKTTSKLDKRVEGIDRILCDGGCFYDMATNHLANFLPELRDEVSMEEMSPPHLTRFSEVGSMIQPSSHTQYNMKSVAGSSSLLHSTKSLHSRLQFHEDKDKDKRRQTQLLPVIAEPLEKYPPIVSGESSFSALEDIQREIDQVIIRPKSRRGENSKLHQRFESESRDEDISDNFVEVDSSDRTKQKIVRKSEVLADEHSGLCRKNSLETACLSWKCW